MGQWDYIGVEGQQEALADDVLALWPLDTQLRHLDLLERPILATTQSIPQIRRSPEEVVGQVDGFLTQGRKGAAKQILRVGLQDLDYLLTNPANAEEWFASGRPEQMVDLAQRLSELGDRDAAAIILARNIDDFMEISGADNPITKTALSLIREVVEAHQLGFDREATDIQFSGQRRDPTSDEEETS